MLLSQALDTDHKFSPQAFAALADLLSPELIDECLADTGVDVRPAQIPESRYRGPVQPALGDRARVQGDEAASAE